MAVPTFVASGAHAVGIGDVSPGLPTGWAADDIFLLQVESFEGSVAAPTGYTLVAEVAKGTADANESFQTWFWKRATADEAAPTVTDPGDHALAVIHAFRGCITTGNPWNIQYSGTDASGTTDVSIAGNTTTIADTLIIMGLGQHNDTGTYTLSTFANADLATVTIRWDEGTIQGNGGCIGLVTGEKATAGAYGATTGTVNVNSGIKTFIVFALKPPVAAQTVITGVAAETDLALVSTVVHDQTIITGVAVETDSALAATAVKTQFVTTGVPIELDSALLSTVLKTQIVETGIPIETDIALVSTVGGPKVIGTGVAVEIDSALAATVSGPRTITTGIAIELDTALSSSIFQPIDTSAIDLIMQRKWRRAISRDMRRTGVGWIRRG